MNVIGEIKLFSGKFNPPGFIDCDGEAYPVPLYRELFAVIGHQYTKELGGNLKYFNVPSMDGLVRGTKYIICVDGYFPTDQLLEIYKNSTGNLISRGQIESNYKDPRGKKLITYTTEDWQNYNIDTDEFEGK
jgi:hypothetical protein